MIWIVREFWPLLPNGTDEDLEDAERIEAPDPEEAARLFMERVQDTGDLYEWIGDNNRCALLVRGEAETADHLIEVTVDWSPDFYAAELPALAAVDPSAPSCERPSCKHPWAKHGPEGCGVLHCRCSTPPSSPTP